MSLWVQSKAGSASLREPEERAEMRGEMKSSESERESSRRGPGMESDEGEDGEGGEVGDEEMRSMRDLQLWESLDWPLRHDAAFLMIFSKAGTRIWLRRESASGVEEAIPAAGRWAVACGNGRGFCQIWITEAGEGDTFRLPRIDA